MAAEQGKFRDWLKRQPPEESLHHTYEYTIREDIVMAMEELELTDEMCIRDRGVTHYTLPCKVVCQTFPLDSLKAGLCPAILRLTASDKRMAA